MPFGKAMAHGSVLGLVYTVIILLWLEYVEHDPFAGLAILFYPLYAAVAIVGLYPFFRARHVFVRWLCAAVLASAALAYFLIGLGILT